MPIVTYLSHPQVQVDPTVPVPNWGLNAVGQQRASALAASGALVGTTRIISSPETKARDTAAPVAHALGMDVELLADSYENDRSATGFLPPDQFEAVADQFFANPTRSIRGWETARDAQTRIVAAVTRALHGHTKGHVLIVGHGAVGTLLWCALSNLPISRQHDQGPTGGGNIFCFDHPNGTPDTPWRPMEDLMPEHRTAR